MKEIKKMEERRRRRRKRRRLHSESQTLFADIYTKQKRSRKGKRRMNKRADEYNRRRKIGSRRSIKKKR